MCTHLRCPFCSSRLLKMSTAFEQYEDNMPTINPAVLRLMKLFVLMGFFAHLIACGWYYTANGSDGLGPTGDEEEGCSSKDELGCSWLWEYCLTDGIEDDDACATNAQGKAPNSIGSRPLGSRYLAALYWSFTTITTIGNWRSI